MTILAGNTNVFQIELKGFGFEGNVLKDIQTLVSSLEEIVELEAFIINNEEKFSTSLSICKAFRNLRMAQQPVSELEFTTVYSQSNTVYTKQECLQHLLKCYVDTRWVDSLENALHRGETTLTDFYQAFTENTNLHVRKLIIEACMLGEAI